MTDRLYIDGQDAFKAYGAFVTEGGYDALVAFPPLKSIDSNDWHEEDGLDADLSSPVLDTREISMTFGFTGDSLRFGNFIESLSNGVYHTFHFKEVGRTHRLRMMSAPSLKTVQTLGVATIQFADDFPLDGYAYTPPASTVQTYDDYELDGRPLTDYGVRVLAGTLDEILKSPAVKPNLLRNIGTVPGAIYDGQSVTFATKDVKVNCLMRAETLDELWRNYNALLYDLVRPGERLFFCNATGNEYPCYYKSAGVTEFYVSEPPWLKFSIVLVFTSFRVGGDEYLLASENDEIIITEDNNMSVQLGAIDL